MRTRALSLLVLALGLLFLSASPGHACLWIYGTDLQGKPAIADVPVMGKNLVNSLRRHEPREFWAKQKARLRESTPHGDHKRQNDLAATLLHLGEIKEAIAILTKIEQQHPGLYATAANLGTAYELHGNNTEALRWIGEGIRRNPDAHFGTEWLHVRILEAKIALGKEPGWLKSHSVLGLDFGTASEPRMPRSLPPGNRGVALDAKQVKNALLYQLRERLEFTTAPDPVVADLLFDFGNLLVLTDVLESAEAIYAFALYHGPVHPQSVKQRLEFVRDRLEPGHRSPA